ncbi:MAG: hypothetical protein Q4C70_09195 [Planctomycetia bacterium]|nr:hypothetical protein [Planctomycetia bacterium]
MIQKPAWRRGAIIFLCALFLVTANSCKKTEKNGKENLSESQKTETFINSENFSEMENNTDIKNREDGVSNLLSGSENNTDKKENNVNTVDRDSTRNQDLPMDLGGILGMQETVSVRSILDGMVTAYKNAQTYRDCGEICISSTQNGQIFERTSPYITSFQRPNHLLLEVNSTGVLADGKTLYAYTPEMQGMLLQKPCPEKLGFLDILSEREIYWALTDVESNRFCYLPPPLVLMLSEDPLKTFLFQTEEGSIKLLTQEKWKGHDCYRISAVRPHGETIFWIDVNTSVLRRIQLPAHVVQKETVTGRENKEMVVTLNFNDAELNWNGTLEMNAPANVIPVSSFMEPQIQLLGKPFPTLEFVTLDGQTWKMPPKKTVFMFFWSIYESNMFNFQSVEGLYQLFRKNPDLLFIGVNIDPISVSSEKIRAISEKFGLTCPVIRSRDGSVTKLVRYGSTFTCFLMNAEGIVQFCNTPSVFHHLNTRYDQKIQQVLDGKSIFTERIAELKRSEKDYLDSISAQIENGIFTKDAILEEITIASRKIAPASEPISCQKTEIWNTELNSPSAVLPLPERNEILILENGNTVVTLDFTGKIMGKMVLKLPVDEYYLKLRASLPHKNGDRFYAVIGKRVAIFDNQWNSVAVYPSEDVLPRHSVMKNAVSDAILRDMDEDGEPELYVSFWNEDGIHKIYWKDLLKSDKKMPESMLARGVQNVFQIAPVHVDGKRELRVVDQSGGVRIFDPKTMQFLKTQEIPNRALSSLVAFDFENDGTDALAALALGGQVKYKAVGLTPDGAEVWNIDLPNYVYQRNIEKIHPLFIMNRDEIASGWLLIGADSSIFLADQTGMLMDQFNFGEIITGCASAVMNGKPLLLIATPKKVTALEIVR